MTIGIMGRSEMLLFIGLSSAILLVSADDGMTTVAPMMMMKLDPVCSSVSVACKRAPLDAGVCKAVMTTNPCCPDFECVTSDGFLTRHAGVGFEKSYVSPDGRVKAYSSSFSSSSSSGGNSPPSKFSEEDGFGAFNDFPGLLKFRDSLSLPKATLRPWRVKDDPFDFPPFRRPFQSFGSERSKLIPDIPRDDPEWVRPEDLFKQLRVAIEAEMEKNRKGPPSPAPMHPEI